MNTVSERLKYALLVRDISQAELARKIGVTRGAISNLINKVSQGLSAENALKIAEALEVDPYWLVFGRGEGPVTKRDINFGLGNLTSTREEAKKLISTMPNDNLELVVKVLKQFVNV
ncbi:helix-turn-helix domain-containing protein [Parasutterella excrementihominis]|jgi:transcriptional regulator with XRE-family HTH domain|uniref:helix-turn-helix domain-containing protein n=1 Tax=Parasutterella excrementihominis TaxID=487175 RepID=UPI003AEF7938